MGIISNITRRQCFSITFIYGEDEELLDALLKFCHKRNHFKTRVIKMALARFLGVSGYDVNEKHKKGDDNVAI